MTEVLDLDDEIDKGLRRQRLDHVLHTAVVSTLVCGTLINTYLLFQLLRSTEQLVNVIALKMEVYSDNVRKGHQGDVKAEGLSGTTPR